MLEEPICQSAQCDGLKKKQYAESDVAVADQ